MISPRSTITRTTLGVAALVALTAGCSQIAERATEEAVERAVESQGEDVDIEFGDDGISIETEEGNLTISADGDGVEIDGTDADGKDFSLEADEDGLEASSDGGGSLDVDADGNFTVTDGEGDVTTGGIDADGDSLDLSIDGGDGEAVFEASEGIPEQWPDDVPRPEGLDEVFGTYVADDGAESFIVAGKAAGSAQDVFDDYVDRLDDAGYEETSAANQGDQFRTASFVKGTSTVGVTVQAGDEGTDLIVVIN